MKNLCLFSCFLWLPHQPNNSEPEIYRLEVATGLTQVNYKLVSTENEPSENEMSGTGANVCKAFGGR